MRSRSSSAKRAGASSASRSIIQKTKAILAFFWRAVLGRLILGRLRVVTAIGLVMAAIWVVGLIRYVDDLPEAVADTRTRTDAIVVLTGGSDRISTGLKLLAENMAKRVFVSGVHPGVDARTLLRQNGDAPADMLDRIETGYDAKNTAGNAIETAAWMRAHGFDSMRLVTSAYHMPRSLLELHEVLPNVRVVPHPVFAPHLYRDSWWRVPGTGMLIISEYNKYLWARLRNMLIPATPAPASEP